MAATIRTFVLSQPSKTERRAAISLSLDASQIGPWSFFDSVPIDQFSLNYSREESIRILGRPMAEGYLCNLMGHVKMIEAFLADPAAEIGLFLEDDVAVDPYFRFANLPALMKTGGLGHLKLYSRFFTPARVIHRIGRFTLYRPSWYAHGTQCYALDRATAQALLDWVRALPCILAPWDFLIDDYVTHRIPAYLLFPFPAMELNYPSSIIAVADTAKPTEAAAMSDSFVLPGMKQYRLRRWLANRALFPSDAAAGQRLAARDAEMRGLLN